MRIVEEVRTGTATYGGQTGEGLGIIDSQQTVGGWPTLNSLTAPTDTDFDGMPDAWETSNGLNYNYAADRNGYDLDSNYTNLEVYINSLVANDSTAPDAPQNIAAFAYDASITLNWNANTDSDLTGYYVYRSTTSDADYQILSTQLTANTNYTDNTAQNGTTYYYVVTAVDSSSNESLFSNQVFATAVDMTFYRDINDDNTIDTDDLTAFAALWFQSDCNQTTGWDINNDCLINLHEFALLSGCWLNTQTPSYPTYIYAVDSCRTGLYNGTDSEADLTKTESNKLSVRGDSKANKSWIKFDISEINPAQLASASLRITLYENKDNTCLLSAVNDDHTTNINWTKTDLTWNTAPGNITSSDGINPDNTSFTVNDLQDNLDPFNTTYIGVINYSEGSGGVAGDQYSIDVLSVLQADTDGIVQFVLHGAGGYTNFTTHDSALGSDYWPMLQLSY